MQAYVEEMGDTSLCKARASPHNCSPHNCSPRNYSPHTSRPHTLQTGGTALQARGSLRGRASAAPRPRLGRTSAAPRPHLGRASAAPRPHLGRASLKASDGAGCGDKEKDFIAKWTGGRVAERRPRGD